MTAETLSHPTYDSRRKESRSLTEIRELWEFRNLIYHLVRRDVTSKYKRSFLGVAWTLLNPLLTMVLMAVLFSALFSRGIEDFPVFILSGIVAFQFFSQSSTQAMTGLLHGQALLNSTYMPRSVFAVAGVGTGLVNLLFSLIPVVLLAIAYARPVTWAWLFIPLAIVIVSAFTLGIGLVLSSLSVFFNDIHTIYGFLVNNLMWVSGTFYYLDSLPTNLAWIVRINPVYHMIRLFRDPLFEGILPRWEIVTYASLAAGSALAVGMWIFTTWSDEYAYRI